MKRVLHVIPYKNLYPPKNGGHLRSFNLMDQLSRFFIVDVLCYQPASDIESNGYKNENIKIYNPDSYPVKNFWRFLPSRIANAIRYRILRRSFKGPANMTVLDFAHIIKNLSKNNDYDIIVFEHLFTLRLSPIVQRYLPKAYRILDAHNIDSKLNSNKGLRRNEESIYKVVNYFWACSENDKVKLEEMNCHKVSGLVIPNGVDIKSKPYAENKKGLHKKILFCGSLDYYPNKEGLIWFYNEIWPLIIKKIEDVELSIIGWGNTKPFEHFKGDPRIKVIGAVDSVESYYHNSFIAIVPLLSGSGTRLKILEAMSFGNPVVTTSIGIEGIQATNAKEAIITNDKDSFSQGIISIIEKPEIGESIRKNASTLVQKKYNWDIIGNNIGEFLSSM